MNFFPAAALVLFLIPVLTRADDYEEAPFHYWTKPPQDPIARMGEALRSGAFRLPGDAGPNDVRAILDHLGVPPGTQVMVYSKTSAQNPLISPERPRAIYFSDNLYLGWVQNGGMEAMSFDPDLGALCYFIDLQGARPEDPAFLTRPQSCMSCHVRASTGGVPGGIVRSVFPGVTGLPYFQAGTYTVDHSTPLEQRWGGWYVTGSPGNQEHKGNSLAEVSASGDVILRTMLKEGACEVDSLTSLIDARAYPGGASSDIVALMVLEHQIQLHNVLVSANFTVRRLRHHSEQIRASLGEPPLTAPEGTLARVIESQARRIVEALLFKDEFAMTGEGVQGSTAFVDAFGANRRATSEGRSLKDFRLFEHLFKNRCSYTIYSEPFQHLTPWLKAEVFHQLHAALTLPEGTAASAHLPSTERLRILTILRETKDDLPEEWRVGEGR